MRPVLLATLAPLAALALASTALGCTGPDFSGELVVGPAFGKSKTDKSGALFQPVSAVLEKRCGTLDCHGSTFRPLRIYGQFGLRFPMDRKTFEASLGASLGTYEQYYTGGAVVTTPEELLQNYQSVIGLEPELTTQVVEKTLLPDALTFIRKPRLAEKHKGGRIWDQGKPGDRCLGDWISAGPAFGDAGAPPDFNSTTCSDELMHK